MHIFSDYKMDTRSGKVSPGAYEWWYFDGTDSRGVYSLTVIFYDGNPFSTRYIKRLKNRRNREGAKAEDHPAVSISVYENRKPVYYSFTEFSPGRATFGTDHPGLRIGAHSMEMEAAEGRLLYRLNLKEELPSGDSLKGTITFESAEAALFESEGSTGEGHRWNLVQPRANMTADLNLTSPGRPDRRLSFTGLGYHDHNTGPEPMRDGFLEWNWGRFHFDSGTLIYYLMERPTGTLHEAWLISPDNGKVLTRFDEIILGDKGWTRFGMRSSRKVVLSSVEADVTIQHSAIIDDGPFYQRFGSDAFLNIKDRREIESAAGLAEYIQPARVHWRFFWPLTEMRIRYSMEPAHWVQRSPRLYRMTW